MFLGDGGGFRMRSRLVFDGDHRVAGVSFLARLSGEDDAGVLKVSLRFLPAEPAAVSDAHLEVHVVLQLKLERAAFVRDDEIVLAKDNPAVFLVYDAVAVHIEIVLERRDHEAGLSKIRIAFSQVVAHLVGIHLFAAIQDLSADSVGLELAGSCHLARDLAYKLGEFTHRSPGLQRSRNREQNRIGVRSASNVHLVETGVAHGVRNVEHGEDLLLRLFARFGDGLAAFHQSHHSV